MTHFITHRMFPRVVLVSALLLGALATPGNAHPVQDADASPGMNMAAMMEAMKLAHPGPEHEELATLAGEWTSTVSIAAMGPGMPPMEQEATAIVRTILGGRFLEITALGDFMGEPFESQSYLGYDRRREEYTLVGMDTLGTYWVSGAGKKEADGVIRMAGVDHDPNIGKQVFTFEYEIFGPDEFEQRTLFHQIGPQIYEEPFKMVTVRNKRKLVGAPSAELDAGRVARGEEVAAAIVETACGQCQFDLPGGGCDLAVRVGDVAWFVTGTSIDEHGDAHAADGFCETVRHARVSGQVKDDRFAVTEFELLDEDEG